MKIGGTPNPLVLPELRQDRSAPVLGDGAVGFDALGVFGVNKRAQPGAAGQPPSPDGAGTPPLQAQGEPRRPNASRPGLAGTAPTLPLPPPDLEWSGGDVPILENIQPAPEPAPESASNRSGLAGDIPHPITEGDAEPAEVVEARASAPRRRAGESPAHALIAATEEGKVSVAVKAPPLDADGRALLRRLVRQILSERRLSLADFHLNGVPLGADFLSMTGGSHGPRAR